MIELNDKNFEEKIKKLIIVDFFGEWCGPCKLIAPIFEELSKEFKGKIEFGKVDVDKSPNISQDYNIQGIPCIIIFKNEEEVDRRVGFINKEALKEWIEKNLD